MLKRTVCYVLTLVLCFLISQSCGDGLLPSLHELDDIQMPSLGSVLHRYPDSEWTEADGTAVQVWEKVTEADYSAFSTFLSTQEVSLSGYSAENGQISAELEKDGKTFSFVYTPGEEKAVVSYPAGTCDRRGKEAEEHYNRAKDLAAKEAYRKAYKELKLIEDYPYYKDAEELLSGYYLSARGPAWEEHMDIPDSLDETEPIEITFWAKHDTNKAQAEVYKQAIQDFQEMYPSITVNLRLYSNYSELYRDVILNISTNTLPNVCITLPGHIAAYMAQGNVVLPLDEWMADPRFGFGGSEVRFDSPKQEEIVPKYLEECILNGKYCALPFVRATEALYINRDMVEKLGYEIPEILTWDFVWEVSGKATEKDEKGLFRINGQEVMIPFICKSTDNMMITMLRQLGAPYAAEDGEALLFNDTTAGLLKEIFTHAKTGAFSTFGISSYPSNLLNAGQCIFAMDSTAGATWMGSSAPMQDIPEERIAPFTTVVRPVPQYDPEHPQMISQGPGICVFNREDPQETLAGWLFAQYLLSDKVQTGYAETEGYLPVTLKAQQSPEYQEYLGRKGSNNQEFYEIKIEASELLLKYMENTFVPPAFNGSETLRAAAGQLIENICKGARRGAEMSDSYIGEQFEKVIQTYFLDEPGLMNETDAP